MTRGTQPAWADKDYGSEPWEDNTDNHTEEMPQDNGSQDNEISRNSGQHVGGWSDQTAYRVRGIIAEELANIVCKLSADANRFAQDRNDGPASSVVSDAQKAACCGKNKIVDPATSVEDMVQEASSNDESRCDTSANILSAQEAEGLNLNKIEHAVVSQEASCQTENIAEDTNCVDVMRKVDARDNLKDNSNLADSKAKEDANSVGNKVEDAVTATSEMATYLVNQNDKELAYIAGILAAGAAYSVGNRSDVQKAAYLAGVRAVDAAYRMANETASSFDDIKLADSTNTDKSDVEAETAAYLAGIRAVEVAHRKAEEKAYMNGIKDAKEVISTKGKVEEPFSKAKARDIAASDLNGKDELLFDRGEECSDIEELGRMSELIVERFAPSTDSAKTEEIKEKDLSERLKIDKTTKDKLQGTSAKNVEPFIDMATFDEMPIKKANSVLRQPCAEVENASEGFCSSEKTNASTTKRNNDKHSKIKCNTKCNPQSIDKLQKTERDCDKSDKSQMKKAMQKQDNEAEAFYVSFDSQTTNTETLKADEKDNHQNTPDVTGKPFIDMATFDEMPIKKAETLLRPPGKETEFVPPNHCEKPKKNARKKKLTTSDSSSKSNEVRHDTCDDINHLNTVPQKQNNAAEAFFVSFDSQSENTKNLLSSEKDSSHSTPKLTGESFIDMASYDEMPIKRAEALLRPPREIQAHDNAVDLTNKDNGTRRKQDSNTVTDSINVSNDKKHDTGDSNYIDGADTQSKNGAADAFFVSFDPPAVDKCPKKKTKKDIPDTSNHEDRPFIDMATFDDMPIKKADALLRPFGNEDEYKSVGNDTISGKTDSVKTKVKRLVRKKGQYGTLEHNKLIENENATRKEKMESVPATDDSLNTQSKNGAADAFFVSFDPPAIKCPKKKAKKDIPDTSNNEDRPFIDMATFDDMPIKKADALLRPFGNDGDGKSVGNDTISGKIDSIKTKVKRLVRKKGQYGTLEHNKLIENENAMRKEKMESVPAMVDSFKTSDDDNSDTKIIKRPPKLVAKKAQYGSVAHNNQIKEGNDIQKKKLSSIKSSLDTWKTKEEEVPKKRAEYGSVAHNNQIKLDNAMRKRRMEEIHSNLDTWNAPNPGSKYSLQRKAEWDPVREPGKYGSVAHFHQIKSNNAKRKKRMNNIQSSLDTWNRPNPGSMYSLKRKDEWTQVSDTRKYGSVAHYHQVKQTQGNNKRMIKGASSRISTWQPKNKMNLLQANNQKGTGGKTLGTHNKVSVRNTDYNTERSELSPRKNDHKLSSWSRYGSTARTGEYEDDQDDVSYSYPRNKTQYDKYPPANGRHSQYRNDYNDESSVSNKCMQQKQSKIPRLVIANNGEGLASSRNKVPKSSLAFEVNHGNRYREVNPLTIDLGGESWNKDYSNWQFQDSARSGSRPLSCRSDGSSCIPIKTVSLKRKLYYYKIA